MIAVGNDVCRAVSVGDAACAGVYVGDEKVFPDAPLYDETKITLVLLDGSGAETDTKYLYDENSSGWTQAWSSMRSTSGSKYLMHIGGEITYFENRYSGGSEFPALKKVEIGNGITAIPGAFFYLCTSLTNVEIPGTVLTIGFNSFWGCTSLAEIYIPGSVTTINSSTFEACNSLRTITVNKAENSISGAPWGATNATVIWTG